ncbi:hypothetical protein GGQ84_000780 [Desulfitispora alkaliphila]|uniref:DUF401 family protein n=1 Tax=Desulfitispora alkaliphila TaxID=622674 RepID=UPI003D2239F1
MELIATIVSFAIVLTIANRKKNLGLALMLGALAMTVLSGWGPMEIWGLLWMSLSDPMTLRLTAIIVLISVFGRTMKDMGHLEDMVTAMTKLVRDTRWSLMLIPSLMGLLPVPGGAALSAPLIDKVGDKASLGNNDKAALNLFFRHIWYLVFPLYPSLILAESISGISVWDFIIIQTPAILIGVVVAWWVFFPKGDREKYITVEKEDPTAVRELGMSILPLGVVLIMALPLGISFVVALIVGITLTLITDRRNQVSGVMEKIKKSVLPGVNLKLAFAIVAIMVFQHTVREVGAVTVLAQMMTDLGMPLFPLVLAISFITGFSTGSNIAAVGATFAVFMPMLSEQVMLPYLSLIYVISLVGYMVSPLHLCLVVTNDYFESEPKELLKRTRIPIVALVLWSIMFIWVYINVI